MPLTPQERNKRRRRRRRRKILVISIGLLLMALIAAAIVWLVGTVVGAVQEAVSAANEPPVTTTATTAYPTLPAETVDGQIHMNSVLLYDVTHDTVLYEYNADAVNFPASLTKLLTAAVACRYAPADTSFVIGSEQLLCEWDSSRAYLEEGATYSLPALVDALLLSSGADAAYNLAVNVARLHENNPALTDQEAVEVFVGYMNAVAAELGCASTHFVTPDGYHAPEHYTTARDMLKIAQYAKTFPLVRQAIAKSSSEHGDWENGNALVQPDELYYYEFATGMKTGYTDEAGFCLAASANKNGVELVAILLGSTSTEFRFMDAAALFDLGFDVAENPAKYTTLPPELFTYFTTSQKN